MSSSHRTEPDRQADENQLTGSRAIPGAAPATDPTNPWHQEAAGINARQQQTSDRKINEPGLTDRDRDEREPNR